MIILAFILAIQSEWTASRPSMDWALVGMSTDSMYFIKPGPSAGLFWQRQEYRLPSAQRVSSLLLLTEVDCPGGRVRVVQMTPHAQPNLVGAVTTFATQRDWIYSPPSSLGEAFLKAACPNV